MIRLSAIQRGERNGSVFNEVWRIFVSIQGVIFSSCLTAVGKTGKGLSWKNCIFAMEYRHDICWGGKERPFFCLGVFLTFLYVSLVFVILSGNSSQFFENFWNFWKSSSISHKDEICRQDLELMAGGRFFHNLLLEFWQWGCVLPYIPSHSWNNRHPGV